MRRITYSFSSNGTVIYLGSTDKVLKSTDFGGTWIDVSTGLGKGGIQALLFDGTNLFAGTPADAAAVYRSTNGGTNWGSAAAGLPVGKVIRSLISFGAYVFAGTEGDGIYRSSDHGDSWVKTYATNTLLAQQLVLTFCTKDKALYAGAGNGIYKSTDGGTTFQRMLNGFPPNIGVIVYSLTASGGNVVAATDSGATWAPVNEGFPQCPIPDVEASCADSNYLFAGTGGEGVWRKLIGTLSPTPTPSASATVSARYRLPPRLQRPQ